jgi:cysteinyl-tRNA synthetase
MAEELLGLEFAIHGGGSDLVFPHHENEAAQTAAARGRPLNRLWMHNGMVETAPEEKMAKSVGNIFLLGEALAAHGAEAVVAFLVSGHYRQPLAFSAATLEDAERRNRRVREFFRSASDGGSGSGGEDRTDPAVAARLEAFLAALADDFNTPRALGEMYGLIADANRGDVEGAQRAVTEMLGLLGLESLAAMEPEGQGGPDKRALELLEQRENARRERDFAAADGIRDQLEALGWEVRDTAEGARLVRGG